MWTRVHNYGTLPRLEFGGVTLLILECECLTDKKSVRLRLWDDIELFHLWLTNHTDTNFSIQESIQLCIDSRWCQEPILSSKSTEKWPVSPLSTSTMLTFRPCEHKCLELTGNYTKNIIILATLTQASLPFSAMNDTVDWATRKGIQPVRKSWVLICRW